jgi:hypothetical protein
MRWLRAVADDAFRLPLPEEKGEVVRQADDGVGHHEVFLYLPMGTLWTDASLLVQVQRVLQRQCLE